MSWCSFEQVSNSLMHEHGIGGPTAIRTRVRGSASLCDIQATLYGHFARLATPI